MWRTEDFARIGQDVTIWPLAKIVSPEFISIGDAVMIDDFSFIVGVGGITLGSFIHIASFVSILGGGEFTVGDFSSLSPGVRVFTGTDDFSGASLMGSTIPFPYRQLKRTFVHIGEYVAIGANTVVLPGVTIGEGAAVGAGSLVLKDCEPWTLYVGSPARPVKPRPRETMLEWATLLRQDCYDAQGNYIPEEERP